MSRFWSRIVHELTPYVPGEQPKLANLNKLNTNENPYGPSPKVIEAIVSAAGDGLRLYPEPSSVRLRETIADYYDLQADQVFIGNGSDEVLAHAFRALLKQDKPLLFPDISYSFYPVYCGLFEIDYRQIPLAEDFSIHVDDYPAENGGIIFPNPNAPTGRVLTIAEIQKLLDRNTDSVVVIDEAYIDFGGQSAVVLIDQYPNLLVTQTLSKSRSLAGLRVGFALGHADLIEALIRVKDSFNSYPVDQLAMIGAQAAFEDEAYFQDTCQKVISGRDYVSSELHGLGFNVIPSTANFVFAAPASKSAGQVASLLRERGIIVRYFNQPRIDGFLRISIGTDQQNRALIKALQDIC